MFDTTAEALLAGAEHTATGPGWSELVLPDIEEDFTVRHAFTFLSANEAEFEGTGGSCPVGRGYVIEAEQSTVFSFGNQTVEGAARVRVFVGEDDPEAFTGELVEDLGVDGITQDLLDAVAALYGAPQCGSDDYGMLPHPDREQWSAHRNAARLVANRGSCHDATASAITFNGTLASLEDDSQAASTTTGDTP